MMNIDKHDDFSHNIEIETKKKKIYIYIYQCMRFVMIMQNPK